MTTKAFQRIYTQLDAITKATVAVKAQGVTNDELATVAGRLAQVVKIKGDVVTLQIFEGTEATSVALMLSSAWSARRLLVGPHVSSIFRFLVCERSHAMPEGH